MATSAGKQEMFWGSLALAALLLLSTLLFRFQPWNHSPKPLTAGASSQISRPDPAAEAENRPGDMAASTRKSEVGGTEREGVEPATKALASLTEQQVELRAAELMQLAMNDDTASLATILKEVRNPSRGIRDAALQAAIQFGSRDALPSLEQAAQATVDEGEKQQLLAAIEFLKLPSLSEVMLQKRQQGTPVPASVSSR